MWLKKKITTNVAGSLKRKMPIKTLPLALQFLSKRHVVPYWDSL
jgi:hypothetical protein